MNNEFPSLARNIASCIDAVWGRGGKEGGDGRGCKQRAEILHSSKGTETRRGMTRVHEMRSSFIIISSSLLPLDC